MIGSESRRNSRNARHSRENGAFVGDGGAIWRYVGEFNRRRTAPDQELLALCTITHSGSWFSSARAGDDGVAVDGATVVANQPIIGERIPTALPDRVFDKHIALGGETVRLERLAPQLVNAMILKEKIGFALPKRITTRRALQERPSPAAMIARSARSRRETARRS